MKIMALSKEFFINRWNVFDLVIVLASLLDLGLEIGSGLSVLRGMRLVSSVTAIFNHIPNILLYPCIHHEVLLKCTDFLVMLSIVMCPKMLFLL